MNNFNLPQKITDMSYRSRNWESLAPLRQKRILWFYKRARERMTVGDRIMIDAMFGN